ncbi:MAG: hypothetical protein GY950_17950 [bacterium]|nr:hypothetical protein [bacterium]
MHRVEIESLRAAVNEAILNMEKAGEIYGQLKKRADNTPYNVTVIDWLLSFDYIGLQRQKNLVPSIFEDVQAFLGAGDVRGLYHRIYNNAFDMLERLRTIQKDLDAGQFPQLSNLWRINQKCSEYKLFGQYVARVFFKTREIMPRISPRNIIEIRE